MEITFIHKIEFSQQLNPLDMLKKVLDNQNSLTKKLESFMNRTAEDFATVIKRIDDATTAEAQRLKDLKAQIASLGLDATTEESIFSQLDAAAARLEGLGSDPENPVPQPEEPNPNVPSPE
jgi:predicted phage tail protein